MTVVRFPGSHFLFTWTVHIYSGFQEQHAGSLWLLGGDSKIPICGGEISTVTIAAPPR